MICSANETTGFYIKHNIGGLKCVNRRLWPQWTHSAPMFSFILMLSSIPKQMLQNKQKEIDWNKWENLSTFAIRLFKIPVIFPKYQYCHWDIKMPIDVQIVVPYFSEFYWIFFKDFFGRVCTTIKVLLFLFCFINFICVFGNTILNHVGNIINVCAWFSTCLLVKKD